MVTREEKEGLREEKFILSRLILIIHRKLVYVNAVCGRDCEIRLKIIFPHDNSF